VLPYHPLLRQISDRFTRFAKRYSGKDGVVSLDVMARGCSPGANLPAVWLRHTNSECWSDKVSLRNSSVAPPWMTPCTEWQRPFP
jgi:hypothetical protein